VTDVVYIIPVFGASPAARPGPARHTRYLYLINIHAAAINTTDVLAALSRAAAAAGLEGDRGAVVGRPASDDVMLMQLY